MPRAVYPERVQILRSAQNDRKRRDQHDNEKPFLKQLPGPRIGPFSGESRRVRETHSENPMVHISPSQVKQALRYLDAGGVIVFPTDTVYGIGCKVSATGAMSRIFELKKRPENRPFQLLLSEPSGVNRYAAHVPSYAHELMSRLWPGGLTLLFPAVSGLPFAVVGAQGKVGIRVPNMLTLLELVQMAGGALVATSANLSGQKSPWSVAEIPAEIRSGVDYVIDAGTLEPVSASTVIDCSGDWPRLLRKGAIAEERLVCFGVKE